MAEALADEGYKVSSAPDGAAALERLQRCTPDVILLDMRMPGVNGWDFARLYRQRPGPHAPIVVMTAAQDAPKWAAEIEAAGCVGKPFELDDLLEAVARHVA